MTKFSSILKGSLLSAVAGFFAAGVVMVGQISEADAALMLRLTDTGTNNTVTITDGGLGDFSGITGVVVFSGSLGSFDVNVSTGISKPVIGSAAFPQLDLNSVNVTGSGPGTIKIEVTDTDFSITGAALTFGSAVGGTTQGTVSVSTFVDDSNAAFGTGTTLANLGTFGGGGGGATPFSAGSTNFANLSDPSSATIVALITHTSGGQISSFDAAISVDEPGTLALLGIGLVGLGLTARRRQRTKAA